MLPYIIMDVPISSEKWVAKVAKVANTDSG